MKLCIFGSRGFTSNDNWWLFNESMSLWVRAYGMPTEIISGCCEDSPDKWGEAWANHKGVPIKPFKVTPELWRKYGKAAGPMRNTEMAIYSDRALGFWDGESRGTGDMILKMIAAKESKDFVDIIFPDSIPAIIFNLKKSLQ